VQLDSTCLRPDRLEVVAVGAVEATEVALEADVEEIEEASGEAVVETGEASGEAVVETEVDVEDVGARG